MKSIRKFLTLNVHKTKVTVQTSALVTTKRNGASLGVTQRIKKDLVILQVQVGSGLFLLFAFPVSYVWHASIFSEIKKTAVKARIRAFSKKRKIPPPVGLEPTTFELEVQHASPLRHGGFTSVVRNIFYAHVFCLLQNTTIVFPSFLNS